MQYMEAYSITQKKHIAEFLLMFLLALIFQAVPEKLLLSYGTGALMFIGIVIAWALSIHRRVNQTKVRGMLTLASGIMCLLFVLRQMRYSFFLGDPLVDEYVRLSYYLPYTLLPLTAFFTAIYAAGFEDKTALQTVRKALWTAQGFLCVLIFTNPLHELLLVRGGTMPEPYYHGPLYIAVVIWAAALGTAAVALLILAGRRSPGLEHSHIPVVLMLAGAALIVWYTIEGGSPQIGGFKLFQIQEVICFMYISIFESMIEIGLISSNSGYEGLFCRSNMNAVILDSAGTEVYVSGRYRTFTEEDQDYIRKKAVPGGVIVWTEDYSAIERLNDEIRSATEEIEDENELIRQEREIREERIRYETKNRLYDKIADTVRDQTKLLRAILKEAPKLEKEKFRERILYATILGAYIKRCGNLMLLADEKKNVSSEELSLSIRESMEYLRLSGCSCDVVDEDVMILPGELLILAYELFERVLETAYPAFYAMSVEIRARNHFEMLISLDSPGLPISADWKQDEIRKLRASLSLRYEDDTAYIRLNAGEAAQ